MSKSNDVIYYSQPTGGYLTKPSISSCQENTIIQMIGTAPADSAHNRHQYYRHKDYITNPEIVHHKTRACFQQFINENN